jgi:lipoprotein-anchoring transpeptidase ErfK/SrfK
MALPVRRVRWRGRLVGVLAVAMALGLAAGCGGGVGAQWQGTGGAASPGPGQPQLVINPVADAKDVSPADPVRVGVINGTLEAVTLTNPDGKIVKGAYDGDKRSWQNTEELGYSKTYTLVAVGVGADGQRQEQTHRFKTVTPKEFTLPYLRANVGRLLDGGTFGVGQPIVVWFDEKIKDRAAAERTLTVTTDPPVVGAWRWMDSYELHWRPQRYWPAGTKVKVEAKVYGRDFGDGLYGQEDRSASFTIGRSKIAIADSKTHFMKIYIDGKQVAKINGRSVTAGVPVSMGKNSGERTPTGQWVDFRTASGPHVVTTKHEVYRMTSASFGITDPKSPNYYDIPIKKSVRISGAGEFVHLADWNIWAHGKQNTSHGCINVAPTYIYWFYNTFGAGDIVDVRNSGRKLELRDGLGDWMMPWDEWVKGSAL